MTSFGTWGLPQMVQKFYAIKSESLITKAALATCLFALIIGLAAYFTGSMSHLFYDAPPLGPSGAPDFDRLIPDMLKTHLPETLMGVILVLVLSASMSTLSSLVLVSASAVAIDLYKGHINPGVSSKKSVALIRVLSALFIVFSYVIARYDFDIIITMMSLSWGAVAGAFMAPYIYGLYWKGPPRRRSRSAWSRASPPTSSCSSPGTGQVPHRRKRGHDRALRGHPPGQPVHPAAPARDHRPGLREKRITLRRRTPPPGPGTPPRP
jgi:SSS family solute:Na+ symporter